MAKPTVTATRYSTKKVSKDLVEEIKQSLKSVKSYGSVELYVQDGNVTQITIRNIRKTANLQIQDE